MTGLACATPAHALGGGVTLTQSGGTTTVTISNAQITGTKPPSLAGITSGPFDLTFSLIGSLVPDSWAEVSPGVYAYEYLTGPSSFLTLTNPSANLFTGTYNPVNTDGLAVRVYSTGKLEFLISSSTNSPSTGECFTGLLVTGASAGTGCDPYLNVLDLTIQTGITGKVPSADPTPPSGPFTSPTVADLLANFVTPINKKYNATGDLSTGGAEQKVTFGSTQAVPSPLPIFGASMAFGFSRRLRQRIAQSKATPSY